MPMTATDASLGDEIDHLLDLSDPQFAQGTQAQHLQQLLSFRKTILLTQDPWRRARWHYWVGFLSCCTGGHPDITLVHCCWAQTIAETSGYEEIWPFIDCCLAQVLLITGDVTEGNTCGQRALAIFEARGNPWWACRTLWLLSALANAQRHWEASLEYCQRAKAHAARVDDPRLRVVGLWRTGSTLILSGRPREGLQWCDAALAHAPGPFDRATIHAVRGNGLIRSGHLDEGILRLEEALAWFKKRDLWHDYSVFGLHLGEGYRQRGERILAQNLFEAIALMSHDKGYCRLEKRTKKYLSTMEKECSHVDTWQ